MLLGRSDFLCQERPVIVIVDCEERESTAAVRKGEQEHLPDVFPQHGCKAAAG